MRTIAAEILTIRSMDEDYYCMFFHLLIYDLTEFSALTDVVSLWIEYSKEHFSKRITIHLIIPASKAAEVC